MGTPILGELLDMGTTLLVQIGLWIKDIVRFIFTNFKYDKPHHLFALSLVLFFTVVIFIGMFIGAGVGIGTMGSIGIGSGAVMSGTSELGDLFGDDFEDREDTPWKDTKDIDGDGTPDENDGDIDGDGIPNVQDYDVDGDSIPNELDPTPCGDNIENCIILYPMLCPNSRCDSFQTPAQRGYEPSMEGVDICSDGFIFHNIPDYCWNGESGDDLTIYVGVGPYYDAVCGTYNTQERLNPRCVIVDDTIWYKETYITCPQDCNDSYDCYKDYTCDRGDNCVSKGYSCCPGGTNWAGYCTDYAPSVACNNNAGYIIGSGFTLEELRHIPYKCQCNSDNDCIGDWGGDTCCEEGTYNEYFCFYEYLCNVSV